MWTRVIIARERKQRRKEEGSGLQPRRPPDPTRPLEPRQAELLGQAEPTQFPFFYPFKP